MRIRNTILWLTGGALAFAPPVALAGYIGFSKSMMVMTAPAPAALVASTVPLPPPIHDPRKPTVAVLLGNTLSEPTDVLGPYAMFAESGAYNVYTVAASRSLRTLTGGLDLVPHLSFDELAARLHGDPDIVVVPQIADIRASSNQPVVAWVRRQGQGHALLFSWCTGAEVLAESGALDGKAATAHWGDLDRLQRVYPKVHWQRGVRYVDGGALLSTAGLTAGVDATLHLLARRDGTTLAARVAEALQIPPSPFVENPQCRQFEIGLTDSIFLLNASFRWPKPRLNVWLYDGVSELELGSAADVYGVSAAYRVETRSTAASVVSPRNSVCAARASPDGSPGRLAWGLGIPGICVFGGGGGSCAASGHVASQVRGEAARNQNTAAHGGGLAVHRCGVGARFDRLGGGGVALLVEARGREAEVGEVVEDQDRDRGLALRVN